MTMKNAIFLTFDDNFALYARACLNSMTRNYPDHPELLVFYQGQDPQMLKFMGGIDRLTLLSDLNQKEISSGWNPGLGRTTRIIYDRYCLWTDFFDQYDNLLHLDVDTLILKPFDELLTRQEFVAMPDHSQVPHVRLFTPGSTQNNALLQMLKEDELPLFEGQDDMCNAGVFLLPKKYRTEDQHKLLLYLTTRYNDYLMFADQSAISLWCKWNKIDYMPAFEYNFQINHFETLNYKLDDISILHYSTKHKPDKIEFMLRKDVTSDLRRQLASLFFSYLDEEALLL